MRVTITDFLLVFIFGGAGSTVRYLISKNIASYSQAGFPWPTFAVNVAGCLLIGFLTALFARNIGSESIRIALVAGFCGGFTTFSTFSKETFSLMQNGMWLTAGLYILGSIAAGLLAVYVGMRICLVFK